jgi:hypothetical protein
LGGYDGTRFVSGHEQGRSTVSLWRYDGAWTELGEVPGISRAAQDSSAAYTLSWSMRREAMSVGPGAVVLGSTFGELVVSGDGGETWETWRLPWRPSECQNGFVPCSVAVSGDYVVAAAEDTWLRRKVGSDEWEDITPPGRARYNLADDGRYGLLALDDGTLVATADDIVAKTGAYRVSTDSGSTWSDPRPNPGDHSQFDWTAGVQGPAVYAGCWMPDGRGCGYYRSTDLVRWAKVAPDQGPESPCPGQGYVEPESVIQVGTLTYAIAHVPYLDGHPATTQKQLGSLDFPHDVRHVLRVSGDDCRTWQSVPE